MLREIRIVPKIPPDVEKPSGDWAVDRSFALENPESSPSADPEFSAKCRFY
jgi:hypothetical protein